MLYISIPRTDLKQQSIALHLLLARCSTGSAVQLTGVNHKMVSHIRQRLDAHLCKYLVEAQKEVSFNDDTVDFVDVEVDEVTYSRIPMGDGTVRWKQLIALMRRGHPSTLVLCQLPDRCTPKRAPGPGPLTLVMWRKVAVDYLVGTNAILHTDSAKAYGLKVEGLPDEVMPRTSVVHQVKKVAGHWVQPVYSGVVEVDIGGGLTILVKKGT
eukprot:2335026-Amphidinium_carterae.1